MNRHFFILLLVFAGATSFNSVYAQEKKEKSSKEQSIQKDVHALMKDVVKEIKNIDWKGVDKHLTEAAKSVEKSAEHLAASAEKVDTKKLETDLEKLSANLEKTKTYQTLKKHVKELSDAIEEDLK